MADVKYDVLGIGNALFDVLVKTDEAFLGKHGMTKEVSGGSAANTIVGIGSLGARAAYVGKVKDDQIGKLYVHDIRAAGVAFNTPAAKDGPATGCSYILVTDDGERTMNTYLGAAQDLSPADIDPAEIASAGIVYLEGYLWDPKNAKDAFVKAAQIAHDAKRKVALTLSDSFCVDRYRDEFLGLMRNGTVDKLGVVTRSEKGCVVVTPTEAVAAPASPIAKLVDTTGAGDLFAAGFLYGLARNLAHKQCGELGALAAAEVIQHIGARPQVSLKELAQQRGLTV
jgi:sugar/nucleoside kinase (ribokinase family)